MNKGNRYLNLISTHEPGFEKRKFRIYGNTLGEVHDVAMFLYTIEANYNNLLAYDKAIMESVINTSFPYPTQEKVLARFMRFANDCCVEEFIAPEDKLIICKISFNSPGFWEVLGSWNPLNQIREYINERHARKRDKEYAWELDKRIIQADVEKKCLENDMLRVELIQTITQQLQSIGVDDEYIIHITKNCYKNLEMLNEHIDEERITKIEVIDDEI